MAFFSAASKADFQQQLQTALAQHVDPKILPQLSLFAEQFFGIVALPELTERRMSDLVGSTLASWRLLERFDPSTPEVQVFNPDFEKHGWQSTHSVVEVLHRLMDIVGSSALVRGGSAASYLMGELEYELRASTINTFGGGTNEIQRELIAQFGLGMPRPQR